MASSALATIAAATAAGYKLLTYTKLLDRKAALANAGVTEVQFAELELHITGDPGGGNGGAMRAVGYNTSLTTAKANCLAALNSQRLIRYGADSGQVSGSSVGSAQVAGTKHTVDKT